MTHPGRAAARRDDVRSGMAAAEKAQRYEAFVSDVLQRDLRWVTSCRDSSPGPRYSPGPPRATPLCLSSKNPRGVATPINK